MPLENISNPITGEVGAYENIFPSQRPLNITATRKDATINAITSGTDGLITIESTGIGLEVQPNDFITWQTDTYTPRSTRIVRIISQDIIEVDELFFSTDASNGFLNFKKNWFFEVRYVRKNEITNDQNAITLLPFIGRTNSAIDGTLIANISYPSTFIKPDFELTTGVQPNLFTEYKIQYRESWENNRENPWISPDLDLPIMLVHGTTSVLRGTFSDAPIMKRYYKGFPIVGTYVYSNVNDGVNGNEITIFFNQYRIDKSLINTTEIARSFNVNGVYVFVVEPSVIQNDTVFIEFTGNFRSDIGQYSPFDYFDQDYNTSSL